MESKDDSFGNYYFYYWMDILIMLGGTKNEL